jgi:uncharacterized membrane protein YoaK (UPF0700 family)
LSEAVPGRMEAILCLTAFAAGTADIISFTKLGGTLASAMTGNLALLGLYLGRGSFDDAIGSLAALLGFVAGAALATGLVHKRAKQTALTLLLPLEFFLLAAFALLWFVLPHRATGLHADILVALLAMGMGAQTILAKKINLANIPTVVFTSTLTNIVVGVTETLLRGEWRLGAETKLQMTTFALYFSGALCAGVFAYFGFGFIVLLPLIPVAAAWLLHLRSAALDRRMG